MSVVTDSGYIGDRSDIYLHVHHSGSILDIPLSTYRYIYIYVCLYIHIYTRTTMILIVYDDLVVYITLQL